MKKVENIRKITLILFLFLVMAKAFGVYGETNLHIAEFVVKQGYKTQLNGSIEAEDNVNVKIYDERGMKYELDEKFSAGDNIVGRINEYLRIVELKPGEKTIYVYTDGMEIYRAKFYVLGAVAEETNCNSKCIINIPCETYVYHNSKRYTVYKIGTNSITVELPASFGSGLVLLNWVDLPENLCITFFDEKDNIIGEDELPVYMLTQTVSFDSNTRKIVIDTVGKYTVLANIAVYKDGCVPSTVQIWKEIPDELDILFVSTHQDDEFLFFGGAIPYYNAIGKKVGIVYVANCGTERYYEALSALWVSGQRYYPLFLGYKDEYAEYLENVEVLWKTEGDLMGDFVEILRRYKPKVVVMQDYNGEYGHQQHIYTVKVLTEAVKLAAMADKYPETYQQYGTWQVNKLYSHLYNEKVIYLDWKTGISELDGISPIELAIVAYDRNRTQLNGFSMELYGICYDNSKFGLVYSNVGDDVIRNDFLENVE